MVGLVGRLLPDGGKLLVAHRVRPERRRRAVPRLGRAGEKDGGFVALAKLLQGLAGEGQRIAVGIGPIDDGGQRLGCAARVAQLPLRGGEQAPRLRSEERRVGKGCVGTCKLRWSLEHQKKKKKTSNRAD